jgi:TolB protein
MKNKIFTAGIAVLGFWAVLMNISCATTSGDAITYDSATLSNVVRVTDNGFRKDGVRVSPDGTKILYCEANVSSVDTPLPADDFTVMLLRDANLSAKTPLITDPSFGPVWFDDNSNFIYVTYENNSSKLVRSNITGGGKVYITKNAIGDFDSRPSVRGKKILCDTLINGKRNIVSLNDDGSEVTILGDGEAPSWHPDGNKFVFIRGGGIYEMDLKNNQVTQIYQATINKNNNLVEECSQPSYSKDGKYILFAKGSNVTARAAVGRKGVGRGLSQLFNSTEKMTMRRNHLFIISANGTGLTQLTSGNVDVFSPSWGNNNEIYFISSVQNANEIWKAKLQLNL